MIGHPRHRSKWSTVSPQRPPDVQRATNLGVMDPKTFTSDSNRVAVSVYAPASPLPTKTNVPVKTKLSCTCSTRRYSVSKACTIYPARMLAGESEPRGLAQVCLPPQQPILSATPLFILTQCTHTTYPLARSLGALPATVCSPSECFSLYNSPGRAVRSAAALQGQALVTFSASPVIRPFGQLTEGMVCTSVSGAVFKPMLALCRTTAHPAIVQSQRGCPPPAQQEPVPTLVVPALGGLVQSRSAPQQAVN
jgi:hypothetical protein